MADGEGPERGAGCCGVAVPFLVTNSSVEPRFSLRNVLRALGAPTVPLTLSQQRSRGFASVQPRIFHHFLWAAEIIYSSGLRGFA